MMFSQCRRVSRTHPHLWLDRAFGRVLQNESIKDVLATALIYVKAGCPIQAADDAELGSTAEPTKAGCAFRCNDGLWQSPQLSLVRI
jgi:hypothetical protein